VVLTSRPAGTNRAPTIVTAGRRAMLRCTQPAMPPPPGMTRRRDVRPSAKSRWSPATDPPNAAASSPSAIGTSCAPIATADAVISNGSLGTTGNGPSNATSSANAGSSHALWINSPTSILAPSTGFQGGRWGRRDQWRRHPDRAGGKPHPEALR
jgi:hypothetical protein